jgi:hypothetical protein
MKIKIIHAMREDFEALEEAVAIVDATDKTPDCDFFEVGFKISGTNIINIDLPEMLPLNETWVKKQI